MHSPTLASIEKEGGKGRPLSPVNDTTVLWRQALMKQRRTTPTPLRTRTLAACLGALATVGLSVPAFAQSGPGPQNWMHPAGIIARWQLNVFHVSLLIVLGVAIVVSALLIYTLIKFRDRSFQHGTETEPDAEGLPPQIDGNQTLEIIWTIIPVILLVIL